MGVLKEQGREGRHFLRSRMLIGRSRSCHLILQHRGISGEHALLLWTTGGWRVRDLGSRNGTFVEGKRVNPGALTSLGQGQCLRLGSSSSWVLEEAREPTAVAISGGTEVAATKDLLVLPDLESPEVSIYRDELGAWVVERDGCLLPGSDGMNVVAGGRPWKIFLPHREERTVDEAGTLCLSDMTLVFQVSRDEEHIHLTGHHGSHLVDLGSRAHHYLLLTLARVRVKDRDTTDLVPSEHGWVHRSKLVRMLGVKEGTMYAYAHRARHQLAQAGIREAAALIQQRADTHEWRLGTSKVEERLGV